MQKYELAKGFTILELLAVLIILSILATITITIFGNKSNEAKTMAHITNIKMLKQKGESYIWQESSIPIGDITDNMVSAGYINKIPIDPMTGAKDYMAIAKSDGTVEVLWCGGYNGVCNSPQLVTGMTPVKWNGTSWVKADATNTGNDWYKYNGDLYSITNSSDDKYDGIVTATDTYGEKWANVMLRDGCDGNTSFNGSMFVWIPRYTYKIISCLHTTTDTTTEKSIKIAIKYSVGTIDETNDGYRVHPAFTFGGKQLTGIWVAKFQASQRGIGQISTNTIPHDDVTSIAVQVKPSVSSWRYISIGKAFKVCRNMETDSAYGWGTMHEIDSHLMRNVEWGAVAYLTEAIRDGEEIWINNYSGYSDGKFNSITGLCSKDGRNVGGTTIISNCVTYAQGLNTYYSDGGARASTTGNIYGLYDINGGSNDLVAAYINNGHSNITTYGDDDGNSSNGVIMTMAENSKYVEIYESDYEDNSTYWAKGTTIEPGETLQNGERITTKNYNKWSKRYGDAVYEVSNGVSAMVAGTLWWNGVSQSVNWAGAIKRGWYDDYNEGSWYKYLFFTRGGNFDSWATAGAFAFACTTGAPNGYDGFRPVLTVEN